MILTLFPALFILQTLGPGAYPTSAIAFRHNQSAIYSPTRYAASFEREGSVTRYRKHNPGIKNRSNYLDNSPAVAATTSVQQNSGTKRGRQPVVRIAHRNAPPNRASNHFSIRKEAVKPLKLSASNVSDKKSPQSFDKTRTKLLMNEVFTRSPVSRVVVRKRKNKPADKGIAKLISTTSRLVSNDDVVNINGAAEEYFDEISEELVNNSLIDFREKHAHQGRTSLSKPTQVDEIITNSLFHSSSSPLRADESKTLVASIKVDALNASKPSLLPNLNVEISNNNNKPSDFGDRIASKGLYTSTEINVASSASEFGSSTLRYYLKSNKSASSRPVESRTTKSDQTARKASTISETFLAPLQAGFLLYSDSSDERNSHEFEDNILSDTIQSDQTVVNTISVSNKTKASDKETEKSENDKTPIQLPTTVVESYRSNPVVEIVEKSIDGSSAGKFTEQTFYYSTITHSDGERPTLPINTRPPPIKLDLNESEVEVTTASLPLDTNSIFRTPVSAVQSGRPLFPQQLQLPYPAVGNNFGFPIIPTTGTIPAPLQVSYRMPGNVFFLMHTQHHPVSQFKPKVVKDDYWGPVPLVSEYSVWNNMHVRQQRQLNDVVTPRMEYGFKPLMRPSIEINDKGLPLVGS